MRRSFFYFLFLTAALAATPAAAGQQTSPTAPDDPDQQGPDRIFGVLPNFATVQQDRLVPPITTKERFRIAALDSFDPYVYPMVGIIAGLNALGKDEPAWTARSGSYARYYGASFADGAVAGMMTTAVMPTVFRQDPRYFVLGAGGFWHRADYAVSRLAVTKGRSGSRQFNVSEFAGNFAAAGISGLYYPRDTRTMPATLERWGMQMMWDSVANELKEFWPDIKHALTHKGTVKADGAESR